MAITLGHLGRHHEALEMKQEVLKRRLLDLKIHEPVEPMSLLHSIS